MVQTFDQHASWMPYMWSEKTLGQTQDVLKVWVGGWTVKCSHWQAGWMIKARKCPYMYEHVVSSQQSSSYKVLHKQTKTVMPCLHWGLKTPLAQVQLSTRKQRFKSWQLHWHKCVLPFQTICFYEKHLDILLKTKKWNYKSIHLLWKTNIFEKWFFTHFIFLKPQINNSNDSLYQDPALIQTQLITMKILDKASSLAHSAVYRPSSLNPEPLLALLIVRTCHYSSARTESRTLKTHSTNSHTNTHRVVSPCV